MKLSNWFLALLNTLIGIAFFFYLWESEEGELPVLWQDYTFTFLLIAFANLIGFAMKFASQGLAKFLSWKQHFGARFIGEILVRNLIVWLTLYSVIVMRIESFDWVAVCEFCQEYQDFLLKTVIVSFIFIVFLSIITFTLFAYNEYAVVQIQSVELKRKQLQLQFEALRSQLSPHYLFNCLNTVSNLVYKDAHLAEEFVRRFAQTYQYVLNKNQEKLVSVAEEIEFVRSFHFLLKTRFGEGLHLDIDLSASVLSSKIPPLTLQILVENAVKHNVISKKTPLHISIQSEEEGNISISNNITQKPAHATSLKVGLNNIRKRYAYFTKKRINIEEQGIFHVQLPVLLKAHA